MTLTVTCDNDDPGGMHVELSGGFNNVLIHRQGRKRTIECRTPQRDSQNLDEAMARLALQSGRKRILIVIPDSDDEDNVASTPPRIATATPVNTPSRPRVLASPSPVMVPHTPT
ncbi:hypothetical protein CCMSSC00406_0006502 [Pleurotus cornucopiae]|uniref:Uncharacterized protein n=1 Tax=Pleurotus cornucopiae TaxID=5321 RepID=A0ACB7IW50_PLECO|nr:hypothetical protein CCMSSC00406_0006502 [Pleurotus cornucopiae]